MSTFTPQRLHGHRAPGRLGRHRADPRPRRRAGAGVVPLPAPAARPPQRRPDRQRHRHRRRDRRRPARRLLGTVRDPAHLGAQGARLARPPGPRPGPARGPHRDPRQERPSGWPAVERFEYGNRARPAVRHPIDDGVFLGTENTSEHDATAIVSLFRRGTLDVPFGEVEPQDHVEVRLLDRDDPAANPNLAFTLADTAAVIDELRGEGHRVLVHCVQAQQRTPSVAVAYAVRRGATAAEARRMVAEALPHSRRHGRLWDFAAGDAAGGKALTEESTWHGVLDPAELKDRVRRAGAPAGRRNQGRRLGRGLLGPRRQQRVVLPERVASRRHRALHTAAPGRVARRTAPGGRSTPQPRRVAGTSDGQRPTGGGPRGGEGTPAPARHPGASRAPHGRGGDPRVGSTSTWLRSSTRGSGRTSRQRCGTPPARC